MKRSPHRRGMRLVQRQRMRLTLRQKAIIGSSLIVTLALGITLFFNVSDPANSYGATNGDYRSNGNGNWNASATWQKYNGSTWVAATGAPSSTDGTITIQSGHTVTIPASVTVDQVVVNSGGLLVLNSGVTMTLANGTGTDLSVSGTFKNAGTVTISASATINFQSTGVYQHNYTTTAGVIPTATWTSGSTCEIIGYTNNNTAPTGMQTFSNFKWNCPSQAQAISLGGTLSNVTGNLTIASTGSNTLTDATTNHTLNVGGDLIITGGTYYLGTQSSQASTLVVGGSFNQSGGTFTLATGSSASSTATINGNFSLSGGTLSGMTGSNATGTIILLKDYSHTGGTLTVGGNSSTSLTMSFQKSGTQNFVASGNTVTGNVDFLVRANSIFSPGTSSVTGRNFTLSASATLMITSPLGISASSATGNVQVTGSRTLNSNANYVFAGTAAQVTGDGLPATVSNLTINNSSGVTLSRNQAVSGTLTLTAGKVTTNSYELQVTSTSTSAISGYSSASWVYGNLRRSVLLTGSYDFPLGSSTASQLLNLSLTAAVGFTSVLGKFTPGNPENPAYPLTPITISGVDMFEFLDAGYWTLTPNSPLTVGIFSVTVVEQGYSNSLIEGVLYSLLYRPNSTTAWSSAGTHSDATQIWDGSTVTAKRTSLITFGDFAIADGDFPAFSTVSLIAGTDGAVGATYLFPTVMRGVDAWAKIMSLNNGAKLSNIDDQSTGYTAAFQPFVDYVANKDGYIEWMIYFKKSGTNTDTTLRKLTATGVDVDGASSGSDNIREYIQATMPTSYALDPATTLTVTNVMGRYKALGSTATVSSIDTSAKEAMFELTYNNVSSIAYRTGAQNNFSYTYTRQTSIYFHSFGLGVRNIALPIKLVSFEGKLRNNQVTFDWVTATETNNDYFTIERSTDGENFEKVTIVRGAGNSSIEKYYSAVDDNPLPGYSYYRLKQTDYDGHFTYSEVETIHNKGGNDLAEAIDVKSVAPNPFEDHLAINFICSEKGTAEVLLVNASGAIVRQTREELTNGYNTIELDELGNLPSGIYFITIIIDDKKVTKKILKS